MSALTVMKQGIREKCIDWAKNVVNSAISTPLSSLVNTCTCGPLYGRAVNSPG